MESLDDRIVPATFTVSNLNHAGAGSLRQAVIDANTAAGADTIVFTGADTTGTIVLTSGEIDITDDVAITGPGAANLTVSGNNAARIFDIADDDAPDRQISVSISGLTFTAGAAADGGAIRLLDDENLTILDWVFTGNNSTNEGAALYSVSEGFVQISG